MRGIRTRFFTSTNIYASTAHLKFSIMKRITHFSLLATVLVAILLAPALSLQGQDEGQPEKDTRPVKNMFESIWLLDNQTVIVPIQGTVEWDFQHRFGTVTNGYDDFYGIFAPSNIRLGLNYVPIENLMLGFGFTKERKMWDFQAKYAILRQGRSGGSPVSLTYLGVAGLDSRDKKSTQYEEGTDRWSYFNQLMVARKLNDRISLQVSGSLSYFNYADHVYGPEGEFLGRMKNTHYAMSVLLRGRLNNVISIITSYDFPLTNHDVNDPDPSLAFGLEMVSSSHAFQIFLGNYKGIVPQINNVKNLNSDFLIGFNITRLWNL